MIFISKLAKFLLIGASAFALVACQTTNKTAETVEESTDNFEYIQAESQAEQERLQQELEQAKQEQDRLQAEANKAREAQALAEEKAREEADAKEQAQSDAAKARAEAAKAREEGIVNDDVPMNRPTDAVYFDFDKSFIVPKFDDVLNAHAKFLKANPDLSVEIQGNCDERGSREYNIGLGNRRALAVKSGLEILGIQGSRISITSFGSEKPMALGHDEASWQQNRRADFVY